MSAPTTPSSLHSRLRHALRTAILGGELVPGARLPSESELSRQHEVSRITVRQALSDLQKEGLIYSQQGKGSFVSRPKAFQEIRRLQGFAEQMAENGHEVVNQLLSLREQPADAHTAARLQLPIGSPVTEVRRLRLLDREPISVEWTWLPANIGRELAQADLATRDIFLIIENDLGRPLGHAELAIDAVAASADIAQALNLPTGSPVLRIERLTHDQDGRPIDHEFLHFRSDTFQYRFRVERHPQASHPTPHHHAND